MPELPEVEIVCRGLADAFVGHRLTGVIRRFERLRWPIPDALEQLILGPSGTGGVLRSVERRSKYLLLGFDTGTLLIHLGMSGTLRRLAGEAPLRTHDHVDFVFGEQVLRYNDPRRFGAVLWSADTAQATASGHALLRNLGVEPLGELFTGRLMYEATRRRAAPIKQVLLSGAVVVGVGNIYASESLFRAGIRPTVAAGRINASRYDRLAGSIRQTLLDAIAAGGSTLRDFVASTGQTGYFQLQCNVYGRTGQPCKVCGGTIRCIRQQQRATFYCPACQRA
ncbi:MAG: bifunctional DNA-formamidopyrimidine glycosylase/DNA-(apurinic or apyrimidinic site) lyase [Lautropia sp.]